jgi:hypothetical protein
MSTKPLERPHSVNGQKIFSINSKKLYAGQNGYPFLVTLVTPSFVVEELILCLPNLQHRSMRPWYSERAVLYCDLCTP